jgi:hypothetical protein
MQDEKSIVSGLWARLSVPVVEGPDLVAIAVSAVVSTPVAPMIANALATWAKADTTWDKRFVALHQFGEFVRGGMRMDCLRVMETQAPNASAFLLRHAMRDAYRFTAPVLGARSALNQWVATKQRRYSDVRVRPSTAVAGDSVFLLHAASLRASLEVLRTCEGVIRNERFTDALCTAPPLYADVPPGLALSVVSRLLSCPLRALDPSTCSPAEICLAEEVLLLATISRVFVSAAAIHVARMRGCVERARVIAAMFVHEYNPSARVHAYPSVPPYTASDLSEARAVHALRATMTVPMKHQFVALPGHVVACLTAAEIELRAQSLEDWYTDLALYPS